MTKELREAWERAQAANPTMRAGQILVNAVKAYHEANRLLSFSCPQVFYVADDHLIMGLRALAAGGDEP